MYGEKLIDMIDGHTDSFVILFQFDKPKKSSISKKWILKSHSGTVGRIDTYGNIGRYYDQLIVNLELKVCAILVKTPSRKNIHFWLFSISSANSDSWISEASLSKLEKFQCSWVLPNMKYISSILFLRQMYWLFTYAFKYIFSQTTIVKTSQNWLTLSKTVRTGWSSGSTLTVNFYEPLWWFCLIFFLPF